MNQFRETEAERRVLTPEAVAFLTDLENEFSWRRGQLLEDRQIRQQRILEGERPDFLPETEYVRSGDWKVAPAHPDLADRRVEITGPVDRKMMINALNSGANVFMADFEDAHTPTWSNMVDGQVNLIDAVNRTIEFASPEGKRYALKDETATLMVRPRGWHLPEKHVWVDGQPVSGSLAGQILVHSHRFLAAHPVFPGQVIEDIVRHLLRRLRVQLEAAVHDRNAVAVLEFRQRLLQAAFANITKRTCNVRPNLYLHQVHPYMWFHALPVTL